MKLVDDSAWVGSRRSSEASKRYDEIANAKVGSTFRVEKGVDFPDDEDPGTIRLRYVGSLRWRGVKVQTALKDGDVYIKVMGHGAKPGSNGDGA